MRIVFIGAVEFSRSALQCLIGIRANVVGVCTLEKSSFNADHSDLSLVCESYAIPWLYTPDVNSADAVEWMAKLQPDVVFCFGWSKLIGPNVLAMAPLGVVGFHPSSLPANRGRHPLIWALALGLDETASTFFFMDAGADSGDILSQKKVRIDDDDDAASLYAKITATALTQIREFVPQLIDRSFHRVPQNSRGANTWRKRGRFDGQIDWRMSAGSIHNLVRALTKPYVGAHFEHHGQEYKVWKTAIVPEVGKNIEPGKIIELTGSGPVVKCGDQGLTLLSIDPPFKPALGEYL